MHFLKHLALFIKNNFMQLQRKWLSLPLVLLFPVIIIGLIATLLITFFAPPETSPVKVGLIDLDQSKETQLVVELIEESSQLGNFIQMKIMSEDEAREEIKADNLSAYIVFPEKFTSSLYTGKSVELAIVGNPKQPTKSRLIKELIDSVARHIGASQANIMTINYYAKKLDIDSETRNDMLFEQFKDFLFYTLGKDQVLDEKEIENTVTTSPLHYYSMASWFIVVSIWLLTIYTFLYQDNTNRLRQRMKLYGVTEIQQMVARMTVTFVVTALMATISFYWINIFIQMELVKDDYMRLMIIMFLYSIAFLVSLSIIETIIPSQKLRLLAQSLLTIILLLLSGSFIPTIYFPLNIQEKLAYVFSTEVFHWIQEIVLHDRLYVNYVPLLLITSAGIFILFAMAIWKEQLNR